jgi:hypothetical protein
MVRPANRLPERRQRALEGRLVEPAGDVGHLGAPAVDGGAEELPVAAVAGDEEDRPALGPELLDDLPALDRDARGEVAAGPAEQPEELAGDSAEVAEAGPAEPLALRGRQLGEGELEMVEGPPPVAPRQVPAEPAEGGAGGLGGPPGDQPEEGAEDRRQRDRSPRPVASGSRGEFAGSSKAWRSGLVHAR